MNLSFDINKEKRKINLITGLTLSFGFILLFANPLIYAGLMGDFIKSMATKILSGGLSVISETISGSGVFAGLFDYCTQDMETLGVTATAYNALKIVGATLALAIAISHIFQNIERGQDQVEAVFKTLVELLITGILINNVGKIMGALSEAGIAIINDFTSTFTDPQESADTLLLSISDATDGGIVWFVGCFAKLVIPWIMAWLCDIAAKFVIIQLVVEIAIRRMFAPLAITDIYQEGIRSPGARYFKKFFAAFLKLAIAAFIGILMPQITASIGGLGTDVDGAFDYVFTIIACNFAAIGIMLKAGEFANDIVGV
jgi:hypothetical protein